MLRALGDLDEREIAARVARGVDAAALLAALARRAARDPRADRRRASAGSRPTRRASTATRSASCRPAACRTRSCERSPMRCASSSRASRATHGPFADRASCGRAIGVDCVGRRCAARARRARSCAASCVPAAASANGATSRSCAGCGAPRWRRCAGRSSRSTRRRLAAFLPAWQGVDRHPRAGAGHRPPARGARHPAGARAAGWSSGSAMSCRAGSAPTRRPGWTCSARAARSSGSARARSGARAASRCTSARTLPLLGPAAAGGRGAGRSELATRLLRERLAAAPASSRDLLADVERRAEQLHGPCGIWSGPGEVTNDAWAPLRRRAPDAGAPAPGGAGRRAGRSRFAAGRRGRADADPGPLVAHRAALLAAPRAPASARRALAELLLERYGVVTREQVLAEGMPRRLRARSTTASRALETLGLCRRGYFVEGMGGAQFALPGAVERLRAAAPARARAPLVLAAVDPAQPYGAALPWPRRGRRRRPARARRRRVRRARAGRPAALRRARRAFDRPARRRGGRRGGLRCAGSRHSRARCARGACPSSRWSASTASPRSRVACAQTCSSSSASAQGRGA